MVGDPQGEVQRRRRCNWAADSKGKVKVMAETFPLDDISDAYEKVANGNVRFRAVINA